MSAPFNKKFLCSIGFLALVGQAWAQSSPPPDYGQKIGDVIVSASLVGTELKKMTQNTTVLTKEDVDSFSEQTIDQVLKNQSSVFLNDQPYYEKDPTGQSLNVRGLGNARTLFLIDGVPANDAMYGTIQWNRVPLSSIEDVELIRGGVSNLYGNMGMGGVLNITTKPISENKGEVSANYGSFNTSNIAASKEFAVNDVLRLRISADYFHTDGWLQYPTISPAQPAKYIQGPMGPEYADARNFRLQGELRLSSDTTGFFNLGSHEMSNPPTGGYSFATKTTNETTFSAGINTKLSADQQILANAFYENTTLWQQNTPTIGTNPTYINGNYNDPSNTFGLGAKYIQNFKEQPIDQLMFGIDGREVAAQNLTNSFGYVVPNAAAGPITSSDYASGNQKFYGVMAQLKSKMSAVPVEATLSLREDQWQRNTPTYWIAGASGVPNYTNVPNVVQNKFSPNLGLLWSATNELSFRGAAYQGFHAPGLNNTLRTYGTGTSVSMANPNLVTENMTGYEGGFDYRWNAGFFQLTGFMAKIKNAVYSATVAQSQLLQAGCPLTVCSGATGGLYSNNQNLQSQGLELQGHYDLNTKLGFDGTYTLTNAVLTWIAPQATAAATAANPTWSQLGGVPQNMGTFGVTYRLQPATSLTTTVRYIGNSWMDVAHAYPVPAYAVVGLRLNHEVTKDTSVYLSAVNLLNRNYITYTASTSGPAGYLVGQPQTITAGARIIF